MAEERATLDPGLRLINLFYVLRAFFYKPCGKVLNLKPNYIGLNVTAISLRVPSALMMLRRTGALLFFLRMMDKK